jgi:hypothetical protein
MSSTSFLDNYGFGCFSINGIKFPRLLFGTSPFFGAGQFGDRSVRYFREFYLNPQKITALYNSSISNGLNAIHIPSDPVIVEAIINSIQSSGVNSFVLATVEAKNLPEELGLCERVKADSVITHGSCTDRSGEFVGEILGQIKKLFNNVTTGIATHSPGGVIPRVLELETVDIILTPINLKGHFMDPDEQSTLDAIASARSVGKKIIAMKSLAAGLLDPATAFEYIADKVDAVAVGITTTCELNEVLRAGKRFFS